MSPVGFRSLVMKNLPGTTEEIAERSGLRKGTIQRWIRDLRKENLCYISGWERQIGTAGSPKAIYTLGNGKDRPPPKALGTSVYSKRYRRKIKGTERGDLYSAKSKARYYEGKAKKCGDPLINAFFGR